MRNKVLKIIVLIVVLTIVVIGLSGKTYATQIINKFGDDQSETLSEETTNTINQVFNRSIYIAKILAIGIALIMCIVLGIKYVTASAGEKAEIKQHLIVYVVGAVIAFGCYGILEIVQEFSTQL